MADRVKPTRHGLASEAIARQQAMDIANEDRNDKAIISDASLWMGWPLLRVKRMDPKGNPVDWGVMCDGQGMTVFLCTINEFARKRQHCAKTQYASVDQLLADGWLVD
jgi:hypothetical protein